MTKSISAQRLVESVFAKDHGAMKENFQKAMFYRVHARLTEEKAIVASSIFEDSVQTDESEEGGSEDDEADQAPNKTMDEKKK